MPSPRCPVLLHAIHGSPAPNAHSVARPSKFSLRALLCKRPASRSCTPSCASGGPSRRLYKHSPCLRLRLLDQLPLRRSQGSVCSLVALDFADLCLRHKVRSWISVVELKGLVLWSLKGQTRRPSIPCSVSPLTEHSWLRKSGSSSCHNYAPPRASPLGLVSPQGKQGKAGHLKLPTGNLYETHCRTSLKLLWCGSCTQMAASSVAA